MLSSVIETLFYPVPHPVNWSFRKTMISAKLVDSKITANVAESFNKKKRLEAKWKGTYSG